MKLIFIAWTLILSSFSSSAATLVFNNGIETGNLSGFVCSGNCPTATTSNVASGNYALSFDLTRSMNTNYRTEATIAGTDGKFNTGSEYWIGYKFRFQDWAPDSDSDTGGIQIHLKAPAKECAESAMSAAPFLFITQNDTLIFRTYGAVTRWTQPLKHQVWQQAVFRFIPARTSNGGGLVEAWVDGNKVASVPGINIDPLDGCGQPYPEPHYLKIGVYKWNWKRGPTQSSRRLILMDDVKIAAGSDGYALVSGGNPTNDTVAPTLSSIASTVTTNSANITWTTNEQAEDTINYGLTSSYGSTKSSAAFVTNHTMALTGLVSNQLYHYQILSTDDSGNTGRSSDRTFTTASSADTTPPNISSASATPTQNGAVIAWNTNEASDSTVNYGLTTTLGSTQSSATQTTAHSITLTGLLSSRLYNYQVVSKDAANNSGSSTNLTFTTLTADTAPPVLTNVNVVPSDTGATVTWTTNEVSDSTAVYGPTISYGSTVTRATDVTSHSLTLTGLTSATLYHLKVSSRDPSDNLGQSPDITFTTTDTVAPTISGITCANITATGLSVNWTTNENSSTAISYGTTTSYGLSASGGGNTTAHTVGLTGLSSGTVYHYRVTSVDAAGNSSTSTDRTCTTSNPADVTPPVISSPGSTNITSTSAEIVWTTDEPANDLIDYGTTASYGASKSVNTYTTSHSVTLSNLNSGTTYHYRITTRDPANNSAQSTDLTFTTTTPDTTPPVISGSSHTVSTTSAVITWTTNEAATSVIDYGLTTYTLNSSDATLVTSHSVTLSGLTSGQSYHYRIRSLDAAGNVGQSSDVVLTTTAVDATAPTLSSIVATPGNTFVTVTWTTNEPATSRVKLLSGTQPSVFYPTLVTAHSVTVTGLTEGTLYNYKLRSVDASGNPGEQEGLSFTTTTTAVPTFEITDITDTGFTVSWTSATATATLVHYGITPSYGTDYSNPTLTTDHVAVISGLDHSTTYYFQICDSVCSATGQVDTDEPIPAAISSIQITPTATTAAITWTTDVPAKSRVDFGLATTLTSNVVDDTLVTSHTINLTGLTPNKRYYYKISSENGSFTIRPSPILVFRTSNSGTFFDDFGE